LRITHAGSPRPTTKSNAVTALTPCHVPQRKYFAGQRPAQCAPHPLLSSGGNLKALCFLEILVRSSALSLRRTTRHATANYGVSTPNPQRWSTLTAHFEKRKVQACPNRQRCSMHLSLGKGKTSSQTHRRIHPPSNRDEHPSRSPAGCQISILHETGVRKSIRSQVFTLAPLLQSKVRTSCLGASE